MTLPNSAAVRVTYRGATRFEVSSYFDALRDAVVSPTPATPNVAPGSLSLLSRDTNLPRSGGGSILAVVSGGLAGALLGAGVASYQRRVAPRVAAARELRDENGPPALDVDLNRPETGHAVARVLLDGLPQAGLVAVVASGPDGEAKAGALAALLQQQTGRLIELGAVDPAYADLRWQHLPRGSGAQRLAQDADRTVLAVRARAPLSEVSLRASELRDLGVSEVLLAVVHGKPDKT